MAKSAAYFNVDDFNNYKRSQGRCLPPRTNVLAAANHIQALLDAKKFTYGFMGGLPMLCLGYKREMPDLHIAYDAKDFEQLRAKLESDRRIRLQRGLNSLFPFKILIWTGPEYKDHGCTVKASIELDLIPSGSCGAPAADDLARSIIMLGLQTASGKQMVFKSLNAQHLMATLLSCCKTRDLLWDPRKDILYLCKNETKEIQRIHARLNRTELKELFLGTSFFSRLNTEDQRLCYQTLLASEPPPTMAITPPTPQAPTQSQTKISESQHVNNARSPRSRYRRVDGQRSSSSGASGYIEGLQCVKSARPQAVSAVTAVKEARKSLPYMTTSYDTPSGTDSAQTTSTGEMVRGIQSQKGSLHSVSPEQEQTSRQQCFEDTNAPSPGTLRVVGSEGVHGVHEQPREAKRVQVEHQRHHSAPAVQKRTAPIFELDATTQPDVVFVAELPANSIFLSPAKQHTTRDDAGSHHETIIKPLDVRKTPASLENGPLPASLVAGRPGTHVQHLSDNLPRTSNQSNIDFLECETNVYRYSSYTLPPCVGPEPLSKEVTTPAYQPYRPVVATHELSRTDSVSSVYSPVHKRNASDDSTASRDSSKLAREYQELLDLRTGYGSD